VTETRQTEASRDLIVAEVEHRLKNFLALVSGLARQTPAEGDGAVRYRDAFLDRLDVLTGAELGLFSDAGNDLGYLMSTVLAPYHERIAVEAGPVSGASRCGL
jgi:two-component sensor histidine kinase